jgi:hypothetical protein
MNTRYTRSLHARSSRYNAIGLAAGSIVALVVALAVTFAFGIQAPDSPTSPDLDSTLVVYG